MMTRSRSTKWARLKIVFALPAMLSILFFFSTGSMNLLPGKNPASDNAPPQVQQNKNDHSADIVNKDKNQGENEKVAFKQVSKKMDKDSVFSVVEKMPYYPDGTEKLIRFIVSNIKYPADAKAKGIEGTVFVKFIVKKDGTISNVSLIRGIGSSCDEEAIRVVKLMPKWIPGEQKGKKVDVEFNLPIKFKLTPKEEKTQEKKN